MEFQETHRFCWNAFFPFSNDTRATSFYISHDTYLFLLRGRSPKYSIHLRLRWPVCQILRPIMAPPVTKFAHPCFNSSIWASSVAKPAAPPPAVHDRLGWLPLYLTHTCLARPGWAGLAGELWMYAAHSGNIFADRSGPTVHCRFSGLVSFLSLPFYLFIPPGFFMCMLHPQVRKHLNACQCVRYREVRAGWIPLINL